MEWTAERILELARSFQPAAVLAAAADLDVFSALSPRPLTAVEAARKRQCSVRGMTILLDALAAMRLLAKRGNRYAAPPEAAALLASNGRRSVLPMLQHQANCNRRWSQLARGVRSGRPPTVPPSIRGARADHAAFIAAMHVISLMTADGLVRKIRPLTFRHLLDVGGASGTWTMAFLRARPSARATLFDLPVVMPMARKRLAAAGFLKRVRLVAGDYLRDRLPGGADLAWVSAIVHQNSRAENRRLFRRVFRALAKGGRVAIRDIVMDPDRTTPAAGALFAVNMLVGTPAGGTYTLDELREDLRSAGFTRIRLARRDIAMNSIVTAFRP